jgi:hypothetical protein
LKRITQIATIIVLTISFQISKAQDKSSHEIGIIAGSASFTTDYGQRYNFSANVGGNVGPGVGLVYYLAFTDYRYRWNQRTNYFSEHFKVRLELSYMQANLKHYGEWVEKPGTGGDQLRAHTGKSQVINFGGQMEFHIVDIVDFGSRRIPDLKWSPYVAFGTFVDWYNPTIESSLGDWQDPGVLFPTWDNNYQGQYADPTAADASAGITMSISGSIGIRRKLGEYSDILLESRWQYFFSDYIDGMNNHYAPQNKYNDWLLFIHVGYVYYLN